MPRPRRGAAAAAETAAGPVARARATGSKEKSKTKAQISEELRLLTDQHNLLVAELNQQRTVTQDAVEESKHLREQLRREQLEKKSAIAQKTAAEADAKMQAHARVKVRKALEGNFRVALERKEEEKEYKRYIEDLVKKNTDRMKRLLAERTAATKEDPMKTPKKAAPDRYMDTPRPSSTPECPIQHTSKREQRIDEHLLLRHQDFCAVEDEANSLAQKKRRLLHGFEQDQLFLREFDEEIYKKYDDHRKDPEKLKKIKQMEFDQQIQEFQENSNSTSSSLESANDMALELISLFGLASELEEEEEEDDDAGMDGEQELSDEVQRQEVKPFSQNEKATLVKIAEFESRIACKKNAVFWLQVDIADVQKKRIELREFVEQTKRLELADAEGSEEKEVHPEVVLLRPRPATRPLKSAGNGVFIYGDALITCTMFTVYSHYLFGKKKVQDSAIPNGFTKIIYSSSVNINGFSAHDLSQKLDTATSIHNNFYWWYVRDPLSQEKASACIDLDYVMKTMCDCSEVQFTQDVDVAYRTLGIRSLCKNCRYDAKYMSILHDALTSISKQGKKTVMPLRHSYVTKAGSKLVQLRNYKDMVISLIGAKGGKVVGLPVLIEPHSMKEVEVVWGKDNFYSFLFSDGHEEFVMRL